MSEMNHAEISRDKVLKVLDYLAENGSTICMDGELYENLFAALRQAATDESRIANGELVEVVRCGECTNKPFCECVINNDYEDDDFCSCGERKDGTK